ncbi:MAG: hypothetical protein ACE5I9_02820 [Candidatus Methylomirabilales bacterium]
MRIFVQYDSQGQILSVTRIEEMAEGEEYPFPEEFEESTAFFEIKPSDEFKDLEPLDIHAQYAVDVKKKKLLKKGT